MGSIATRRPWLPARVANSSNADAKRSRSTDVSPKACRHAAAFSVVAPSTAAASKRSSRIASDSRRCSPVVHQLVMNSSSTCLMPWSSSMLRSVGRPVVKAISARSACTMPTPSQPADATASSRSAMGIGLRSVPRAGAALPAHVQQVASRSRFSMFIGFLGERSGQGGFSGAGDRHTWMCVYRPPRFLHEGCDLARITTFTQKSAQREGGQPLWPWIMCSARSSGCRNDAGGGGPH